MSWATVIQKRREKENTSFNPLNISIGVDQVQHRIGRSIFNLSYLEQRAITLRYVFSLPIARVADRLGMSWDGADELIDQATLRIQMEMGLIQSPISNN